MDRPAKTYNLQTRIIKIQISADQTDITKLLGRTVKIDQ
jgi:hypothetical protein